MHDGKYFQLEDIMTFIFHEIKTFYQIFVSWLKRL